MRPKWLKSERNGDDIFLSSEQGNLLEPGDFEGSIWLAVAF
ncbi:hypothetical protein [Photobacterium alginatilyticum]|nr:hypothetical protein [Photobacterium alginatilyticum]